MSDNSARQAYDLSRWLVTSDFCVLLSRTYANFMQITEIEIETEKP